MALLPEDENKVQIPLTTPTAAKARTVLSSLSTASSITLQTTATLLEVNALAQPIFMRYQAGATGANFDEFIQPGGVRHYVVPTGVTVVSFIEQAASATAIVIEK